MKDSCGRNIDYLRISVTDRCNLRCRYCMPEGISLVPMAEILSYEELLRVAGVCAAEGICHLRVTGGEPLVRKGLPDFIGRLREIPGVETVGMTTNGVLLKDDLPALLEAGITGVNISLDTTDREEYRRITGSDALQNVLAGIDAALEAGLPVKINAVSYQRERDWILPLAAMAKEKPVDVRFIELMPLGAAAGYEPISGEAVRQVLEKAYGPLLPVTERRGNGPATYWRPAGFRGALGFISALHEPFCGTCNRVRLTSRGIFKACLCYEDGADLRAILRDPEKTDEDLRHAVRDVINCKPAGHVFDRPEEITEKDGMSCIGG